MKAQFQLIDVDLQACVSDLFGTGRLSGRGNLNISLEAKGSSPYGFAQSLDGTAVLTGHDGAINGFNVEQLLKRLERRPLSGGGNFRNGKTPFDKLNMPSISATGSLSRPTCASRDLRHISPSPAPPRSPHATTISRALQA